MRLIVIPTSQEGDVAVARSVPSGSVGKVYAIKAGDLGVALAAVALARRAVAEECRAW